MQTAFTFYDSIPEMKLSKVSEIQRTERRFFRLMASIHYEITSKLIQSKVTDQRGEKISLHLMW